jgi:hypothetical protein
MASKFRMTSASRRPFRYAIFRHLIRSLLNDS